jgi:hypothetical protein
MDRCYFDHERNVVGAKEEALERRFRKSATERVACQSRTTMTRNWPILALFTGTWLVALSARSGSVAAAAFTTGKSRFYFYLRLVL